MPSSTRRLGLAMVPLIAVGSLLSACTSEPKTPEEQRKARVEARIAESFSRSQTGCIMKVLDDDTIEALDKGADLPADSEALRIYTNALVACAGGS
jgi:hypothetical protein